MVKAKVQRHNYSLIILLGAVVVCVLALSILLMSGSNAKLNLEIKNSQNLETNEMLRIFQPVDGSVVITDKIVVKGKVVGDGTLTLDGQGVAISPDGSFESVVTLAKGLNIVQFKFVSSGGEEIVEKIGVNYEPID